MPTVADRIRLALTLRGLKQADLVRRTGIGKSSICTYLAGDYEPKQKNLQKIAQALQVSADWLRGEDVPMEPELPPAAYPYRPTHRIPILGRISAGRPLFAEEHIEGYTTTELNGGADYFALRVVGDSMSAARINEGDLLIVRRQDQVENGQIAVVMVNGEDATVKKYYRNGPMVSLVPQSLNPEHQMTTYDLRKTSIQVLGLVVQNVIQI